MIKTICFLGILLAAGCVSAQGTTAPTDTIYNLVAKMPVYRGGEAAMMKFIQEHIRYPELENNHDIQGRVVVAFVVNEDGRLSDIRISQGLTKALNEEALRVVRMMPKFEPGEEEGRKVKVRFLLPIQYRTTVTDEELQTRVDTTLKNRRITEAHFMYLMGWQYLQHENYLSALPWLSTAAEMHHPAALYATAYIYNYGKGVEIDYTKGIQYLREAADSANDDAQLDLGYMYEMGHGVTADKVLAAKWYRKSADQNNRLAIGNLANFYEDGRGGLPKDDTMARHLYQKAADMGSPRAQYHMGLKYEKGEGGLPVDSSKALVWFQQAAGKSYALALVRLGDYTSQGLAGTRHSESIATDYYMRAANSGESSAQYQVAYRYEHGENGLPLNVDKAFYYYGLSAKQNNASAQNNYAWMCYLHKRDTAQGLEYVQKAMKADTTDKNRVDTYAALLFLKGDYAEAERQQKRALDMGGNTAGYLERYGNILMKLNRKEEAMRYWKQAVALPDHGKNLEDEIAQGRYID